MNWGIRGISMGVLLSLTGCALNESAVQGGGQSSSSQEGEVASNKMAMFVFPQSDAVSSEVEKGYFVEFEITESSEAAVLQYKD